MSRTKAAFLPEDVVAEILARVVPLDVAFLFRCTVVCKRWLRLLRDPAVVRRLLPSEDAFLGFFGQQHREASTSAVPLPPAFVPAPGAALWPPEQRRFLTSFIRGGDGYYSLLEQARPLAARDGLLLLRVYPLPPIPFALRLCVCNLLTGKLDVLPPLDACSHFDEQGVRGPVVLTAADHGGAAVPHRPADGYSTFFQMVLLSVSPKDSNQIYVHRFSSSAAASQTWSAAPTTCFCATVLSCCCITAICRGTARWLIGDQSEGYMHTLDVSVNTARVSATEHSPGTIGPTTLAGPDQPSNAFVGSCSAQDGSVQ